MAPKSKLKKSAAGKKLSKSLAWTKGFQEIYSEAMTNTLNLEYMDRERIGKRQKSPNSFNLDYQKKKKKKTKDPPKNLNPIPRKEGRIRIETKLSLQ